MIFDFDRFSKIAASVYNANNPFTLEQCLYVFREYFQAYEDYRKCPHPPIRAAQIGRIMQEMPWIESELTGSDIADVEPEFYPLLISLHFKTRYRRCDYNINHFFSGRIRELRLYEAEKGYE